MKKLKEGLTVEALINSEYDPDTNHIYLEFDVDDVTVVAVGSAPEGSFTHWDWFDHQENIDSFVKGAMVEERE